MAAAGWDSDTLGSGSGSGSGSDESEDLFATAAGRLQQRAAAKRPKRPPVPVTALTIGIKPGMGGKLSPTTAVPLVDYDTEWEGARAAIFDALKTSLAAATYGAYNASAVGLFWVARTNRGTPYWAKPGGALHPLATEADFNAAIQDASSGSGGSPRRADAKDKGGILIAAQMPAQQVNRASGRKRARAKPKSRPTRPQGRRSSSRLAEKTGAGGGSARWERPTGAALNEDQDHQDEDEAPHTVTVKKLALRLPVAQIGAQLGTVNW